MEHGIGARVRPVAVPCLLIILLAGAVRLVTLHMDGWGLRLVVFGWVIVATTVAAAAVLLLVIAWCRFLPEPMTFIGRSGQIACAMIPGSWVLFVLLLPIEHRADWLAISAWVCLTLTFEAIGAWWFVGGLLRDWSDALVAREQLIQSLASEEQINKLLIEAERDRFLSYGDVVTIQVEAPLVDLAGRAEDLDSTELADAIDTMIITVMRPLAHLIHPVSVRTGLIPAIRALGPGFAAAADSLTVADDSAGRLLDDDVRLQVYRWVRFLRPSASTVTVTLSIDNGELLVAGAGVAEVRALDPMQRVAGLRLESAEVLRVPLRGALPQPVVLEAPRRSPMSVGALSIRLLGVSPTVDLRLAAAITALTAPAQFFVSSFDASSTRLIAVVAAMVASMLVALALSRAPRPPAGILRDWWPVVAWCGLGLASGLTTLIIAANSAPSQVTRAVAASLLIRGMFRYAIPGLLYQLARGLADRAGQNAALLSGSLASIRESRTELLSNAESSERYLAESLHRTVQGRLSAISLLLRLDRRHEAVVELGVLCRETIPALVQRLTHADVMAGEGMPVMSPGDLGLQITDRIDWDDLRSQDPVIAKDFRRVVDECAVNARRHGQANSMRVYLTRASGMVTLHCDDDGEGISHEPAGGLGSRLFDEVCSHRQGNWALAPAYVGARFTMTLALAGVSI